MLLKFSIANYRSIKDNNAINMEARPIKDRSENINAVQFGKKKIRVLKSIALSGINSAGKSNWFKGFDLMREMVLRSTSNAGTGIYSVEPFALSSESDHKPTSFECTILVKSVIYRYGFKCTHNEIFTEWLTMKVKSREEIIFNRTKSEYQIVKHFPNDVKKKLLMIAEITAKNVLYLSALNQFNIPVAVILSDWFSANVFYNGSNLVAAVGHTANLFTKEAYILQSKEVLAKIAPDIDSINITRDALENLQLSVNRTRFDGKKKHEGEVSLNFIESESLGVQKLFAMIGPVIKTLADGGLFWIDDLDNQVNPGVIPLIIDLFNSAVYNKSGAQLVLISNNTHLVNRLRPDQIVFVSKNCFGETSLSLRKPTDFRELCNPRSAKQLIS